MGEISAGEREPSKLQVRALEKAATTFVDVGSHWDRNLQILRSRSPHMKAKSLPIPEDANVGAEIQGGEIQVFTTDERNGAALRTQTKIRIISPHAIDTDDGQSVYPAHEISISRKYGVLPTITAGISHYTREKTDHDGYEYTYVPGSAKVADVQSTALTDMTTILEEMSRREQVQAQENAEFFASFSQKVSDLFGITPGDASRMSPRSPKEGLERVHTLVDALPGDTDATPSDRDEVRISSLRNLYPYGSTDKAKGEYLDSDGAHVSIWLREGTVEVMKQYKDKVVSNYLIDKDGIRVSRDINVPDGEKPNSSLFDYSPASPNDKEELVASVEELVKDFAFSRDLQKEAQRFLSDVEPNNEGIVTATIPGENGESFTISARRQGGHFGELSVEKFPPIDRDNPRPIRTRMYYLEPTWPTIVAQDMNHTIIGQIAAVYDVSKLQLERDDAWGPVGLASSEKVKLFDLSLPGTIQSRSSAKIPPEEQDSLLASLRKIPSSGK